MANRSLVRSLWLSGRTRLRCQPTTRARAISPFSSPISTFSLVAPTTTGATDTKSVVLVLITGRPVHRATPAHVTLDATRINIRTPTAIARCAPPSRLTATHAPTQFATAAMQALLMTSSSRLAVSSLFYSRPLLHSSQCYSFIF